MTETYGSKSQFYIEMLNLVAKSKYKLLLIYMFINVAHLQEKLMGHLGVVLYEYLGEEYPEVLGSILGALKAIVNVIGMTK